MATCLGITKAGMPCKYRAVEGEYTCRIHRIVPGDRRCNTLQADGERCRREKVDGENVCSLHMTTRKRKSDPIYLIKLHVSIKRVLDFPHVPKDRTNEVVDRCVELLRIDPHRSIGKTVTEVLGSYKVPDTELQTIALDRQSAHTSRVSKQTNEGIEFLMRVPIPAGQDTMNEIRVEWTRLFTRTAVSEFIYTDMMNWYNKSMCREEGDWLYRRVLDHAWAFIKTRPSTEKIELCTRLHQECDEAAGFCCDGHITRIINTFVGFIDEAAPKEPVGDVLQRKMAEISGIPDREERILRATSVFEELGIGVEEAAPWIEALGEED